MSANRAVLVVTSEELQRAVRRVLGAVVDGAVLAVAPREDAPGWIVTGTPAGVVRLSYWLSDDVTH